LIVRYRSGKKEGRGIRERGGNEVYLTTVNKNVILEK
jgi:hypothetical protein